MTPTYQLIILGRGGMYTHGEPAATPDLARLAVGYLHRGADDRLGIVESRPLPGYWTDSSGHQHPRYDAPVLVEAEPAPGTWVIGPARP